MTCCLKERHSSFQCKNFNLFAHSLEMELGWLLILHVNFTVTVFLVSQIPEFIGWQKVCRNLIRLPSFWSFMYLLAIAVVECAVILGFYNGSRLEEIVVACFLTENIMTVIVIGVFNFTELKKVEQRFDKSVKILIKLTLVLFCVSNFVMFMIGTTQLSFNVIGLDSQMSRRVTENLMTIFTVVRSLANVVFYHRSAVFFWQKIFVDDRNILSHFQLLDDPNQYRLLEDDIA